MLGDSAYVGKHLLKGLPAGVSALGPIHPKAALTSPLGPDAPRGRKVGKPLTTPREAFDDPARPWEDLLLRHPKGEKKLKVKVIGPCCWYACAGQAPLRVVLVRDPAGEWRDEALLCGDADLSAGEVILGYMMRWAVEVAYCEGKQLLGFHGPMARNAEAVKRAHPMAWFVGGLVILWYAGYGRDEPRARRHRPWYKNKSGPAFADMLACLRLHLWSDWLGEPGGDREAKIAWLLEFIATAA